MRLKAIYLKTRNCPETCPEFRLLVDGTGDASFSCFQNCVRSSDAKVFFNAKDWQRLDSTFKCSKIRMIDTADVYQAIDDWPMSIEFIYNNTVKVKIRGTEDGMPYRIKPIISQLVDRVKLDSLISFK